MDTERFAVLLRGVAAPPSRRVLARALAGLVLGGTLPAAWQQTSEAKKCAPCRKKKKGKCKGKLPDDTPCGQGGRCLKGRCNPAPVCRTVGVGCAVDNAVACCSGVCRPADLTCRRGNSGAVCLSDLDCISGKCIGYRCQGQGDCTGAPLGTICNTDGGCDSGTCGPCWNSGSSTCCKVAYEATVCLSPSQCLQNQCT
jgi:hypothetical protein